MTDDNLSLQQFNIQLFFQLGFLSVSLYNIYGKVTEWSVVTVDNCVLIWLDKYTLLYVNCGSMGFLYYRLYFLRVAILICVFPVKSSLTGVKKMKKLNLKNIKKGVCLFVCSSILI